MTCRCLALMRSKWMGGLLILMGGVFFALQLRVTHRGDFSKMEKIQKAQEERLIEAGLKNPPGVAGKPGIAKPAPPPPLETPPVMASVDFWDEKKGVAVGQRGTILLTEDGGQSWRIARSDIRFDLTGVGCFTEGQVAAVGRSGVVALSEDWGQSWKMDPVPNPVDLHFAAWRSGGNLLVGGAQGACFLRPGQPGWEERASGVSSFLYAGQFLNEKLGWIAGEGGLVLMTTDGGQNWKTLTLPVKNDLTSVRFKDAMQGVVAGIGGGLCITRDGGATWQAAPSITCHIYDVMATSNGAFFAAGESCLLTMKPDNPKWEDLGAPPGYQILAAAMVPKGQQVCVVGRERSAYLFSLTTSKWTQSKLLKE